MRNPLIYILAIGVLLSTGCKKDYPIPDNPFSIEVTSVQAHTIWLELIPTYNDFYYHFFSVAVEDYNKLYGNDETMLAMQDKELKAYWEPIKEDVSFGDAELQKGMLVYHPTDLTPETEYYLVAYPYDGNNNPVNNVTKINIKTKKYIASDIEFNVSLEGSTLTITPSNSDTYLWTYDKRSEIEYLYTAEEFYKSVVYLYEEFGFINYMLGKDVITEDMAEYFKMSPGDEFIMMLSGYSSEVNSPVTSFLVTYAGPGLTGKVEPYTDPKPKALEKVSDTPVLANKELLISKAQKAINRR